MGNVHGFYCYYRPVTNTASDVGAASVLCTDSSHHLCQWLSDPCHNIVDLS